MKSISHMIIATIPIAIMIFCIRMIPVDTLWILQNRTIKLWEAKNEKKAKSQLFFFICLLFALWGCISVWTSNLVRLTDKSAVPYAWASLFFSYGIVAVHYIQVAVSSKGCNNAENEKIAWVQLGLSTLFLIVAVVLAIQ